MFDGAAITKLHIKKRRLKHTERYILRRHKNKTQTLYCLMGRGKVTFTRRRKKTKKTTTI